ncbi:complement C1q and tumor necrosis factor-related protein 9-like [Pecten maximus]|uniref:complement C1q and tumor necrosis factor-related protein 9-like n=1 Tax=Pecten maximus TaxID=6579 RepID=UPI00145826A0|nr:complement C1q and tumor necrosis factor-related protein 9-like [Pecten maximus]
MQPDDTDHLVNNQSIVHVPDGNDDHITTSENNRKVRVATTGVAFHTRLSEYFTNPGDDQPIIMADILTNEGAAFDRSTGQFTCPVSGVYVFFITAVSFQDKHIQIGLLKNGHNIESLVNGNSGYWGSASNMVIVHAQEGDHIWPQVDGQIHDMGTLLDRYYTTFSGFLLYKS